MRELLSLNCVQLYSYLVLVIRMTTCGVSAPNLQSNRVPALGFRSHRHLRTAYTRAGLLRRQIMSLRLSMNVIPTHMIQTVNENLPPVPVTPTSPPPVSSQILPKQPRWSTHPTRSYSTAAFSLTLQTLLSGPRPRIQKRSFPNRYNSISSPRLNIIIPSSLAQYVPVRIVLRLSHIATSSLNHLNRT
jgi:hypothetical protein